MCPLSSQQGTAFRVPWILIHKSCPLCNFQINLQLFPFSLAPMQVASPPTTEQSRAPCPVLGSCPRRWKCPSLCYSVDYRALSPRRAHSPEKGIGQLKWDQCDQQRGLFNVFDVCQTVNSCITFAATILDNGTLHCEVQAPALLGLSLGREPRAEGRLPQTVFFPEAAPRKPFLL